MAGGDGGEHCKMGPGALYLTRREGRFSTEWDIHVSSCTVVIIGRAHSNLQ